MNSTTKEVAKEVPQFIKVYKDGSVERLSGSPYVPPSLDQHPETGVKSKDITISQDPAISARLYLPQLTQSHQKLPVLVYFHGGGFCLGSAFSLLNHKYLNNIISQAHVVAVSVEYRLAPAHPLTIVYEDCWTALQWVTSHSINNDLNKDPWLSTYGDFDRLYIGGDSAGGNIVHHIALRAGVETLHGSVNIFGGFLSQPYFWGSKPIGRESSVDREKSLSYLFWDFVHPSAQDGIDNPMMNPVGPGAPSLAGLGCSKMLVCVADKDELRDRGVWYFDLVKESGWRGEVELFQVEGEDHGFHIINPETENAMSMFKRLASFLKQ